MDALVGDIERLGDLAAADAVLAAVAARWPLLGDEDTPDEVAEALLRLLERSDPAARVPVVEALVDKAPSRDELVWASLRRAPTRTAIDMAGYDHVDLDALLDAAEICPDVLRSHLEARIADVEDVDDLEEES